MVIARRVLFALILVLVVAPAGCVSEKRADRWNVTLDTTSLESLLLHPEDVRSDPDAFWQTDAAYVLAKRWHDNNRIPLDTRDYYANWLARLEDLSAVPEAERKTNPAFNLMEAVREREPVFRDRGVALLDALLPANDLTFATTIHVTTGTMAFGFMTNGQIVCDVLSPFYRDDPDRIWNLLTHECYHIGYGYNRSLRQEDELDDGFVYNTMLDALQNEGLATYLGWKAREFFPVADMDDYRMLDDPAEVERKLGILNDLFTLVGTVPPDSLRTTAWKLGVDQRAYYIAGAHMARTIDRRLGREALLETIAMGPVSFVTTYNDLVDAPMRVAFDPGPREPSSWSRARTAAVHADRAAFDTAAAEMKAHRTGLHPETRRRVERFGYAMLHQDAFDWAVAVFELDVALFPDEANPYDCLAEAHLKSGDRDEAVRLYREALRVDPGFENAKRMLEEIAAGS